VSERGVFAVDRGIWDHPIFANEPLTEREAWIWLIGEAAFKPHRRRVGIHQVELARGQVAASTRFMADKWGWSEPRVRRFLNRLKADAMIDTTTDAGVTVITLRNYNKYQRVSLPSDAASDAHSDAGATQHRRKVEDKEYKESGGVERAGARDPKPATPKSKSLISEDAHAIAGEVLAAMGTDQHDPICVGAPLQVQSWLNGGWHRERIIAGVRLGMQSRGSQGPPSTLRYFEKAIARAHAQLTAPVPVAEASPAPRVTARPLTEFQLKQRQTNDVRQMLRDSAAAARSGGPIDGLLSDHNGQRPDDLRRGIGGPLLALPVASGSAGD
jgi:hypothetical protein